MTNKIIFNGKKVKSEFYDDLTNTLTIKDVKEGSFYLTFDNFLPSPFYLNIINSNVVVIENYVGIINKSHYSINVDKDSKLNRLSILVNNEKEYKIIKDVNNAGFYQSMQIDLCQATILSEENINMIEEGASAVIIDGIYATKDAMKKYQTNLNHHFKNTMSKAQIFAINDDQAQVNIYTDAFIKNGSHGVKTTQEGRIINLTPTCSGIVLPNLHIDENDVEASHSCSVGSVNADHLYYLQTRGFSETQAKNILIRGYFNPLLKNIEDERVKDEIIAVLEQRIG